MQEQLVAAAKVKDYSKVKQLLPRLAGDYPAWLLYYCILDKDIKTVEAVLKRKHSKLPEILGPAFTFACEVKSDAIGRLILAKNFQCYNNVLFSAVTFRRHKLIPLVLQRRPTNIAECLNHALMKGDIISSKLLRQQL